MSYCLGVTPDYKAYRTSEQDFPLVLRLQKVKTKPIQTALHPVNLKKKADHRSEVVEISIALASLSL